ncbi:hypothetical protein MRX96_055407 [Rhipicephalus microplus]
MKKAIDGVEETRSNSSNSQYAVLQAHSSRSSEWMINTTVKNSKLKLKVDAGSQFSLICLRWLKDFGCQKYELQKSKATLQYFLRPVSSAGEIDPIYDPRRKPSVAGTYLMMR